MRARKATIWEFRRRLKHPELADLVARLLVKLNSGHEPDYDEELSAIAYKLSRGGKRILSPGEMYVYISDLYKAGKSLVTWDVLSEFLTKAHREAEKIVLLCQDSNVMLDVELAFEALARLLYVEMLIIATSLSNSSFEGIRAIKKEISRLSDLIERLKKTISRRATAMARGDFLNLHLH